MKKRIISILTATAIIPLSTSVVFSDTLIATGKEQVEIVSLRSEYGKQYDNGDGTITSYVNSVPIHYLKDGEWNEIDNTLIMDSDGNYTNKSNSFSVSLPSRLSLNDSVDNSNDVIGINYNNYDISISLKEQFSDEKCESSVDETDCVYNIEIDNESNSDYPENEMPRDLIKAFNSTNSSARYSSVNSNSKFSIDIESQAINTDISIQHFRLPLIIMIFLI